MEFGGKEPEIMKQRISKIVDLPEPFLPKITVIGLKNSKYSTSKEE